jgi:hypothetical protein
VLELEVNLLSLFRFTEKGASFKFNNKESLIFNRDNILLAKGYYANRISMFSTISNNIITNSINNSTSILASDNSISNKEKNTILAHKRLGHISKAALEKLPTSTKDFSLNLDSNTITKLQDCITCIESKFTK